MASSVKPVRIHYLENLANNSKIYSFPQNLSTLLLKVVKCIYSIQYSKKI